MKKLFRTMLAICVAAFTITACTDVPEPYQIPGSSAGGGGNVLPEGTVMQVNFKKGQNQWKVQDVNHPEGYVGAIWTNSSSYGMVATAYEKDSKTNYASESWLISPAVDLSTKTQAYLTINHAANYFPQAEGPSAYCSVMVSTDYVEGAPTTATWEPLELSQWPSNSDFTYVDATADMSKYAGQPNVSLAFKYTSTSAKAGTWEIASASITEKAPEQKPDVMPEGLTGSGTAEDPYTVADALKIIEQVGEAGSAEVYVKGIVSGYVESDPFNASFGNLSYFISDDGTTAGQLEVYRGFGLNGDKFKSGTDLKQGDVVIVVGKLVNFKGKTPEFTSGSKLYSLNGQTAGGGEATGEAKGTGTLEDPFNALGAAAYAKTVGTGESEKDVYIKGKVSTIKFNYTNDQYGNATFYISEDGTTNGEFYCYRVLYLGNEKYTSGDVLKVGDEVIICGKVTNYSGNTPETVQNKAYLYSLNGQTKAGEGGGDEPQPTPVGNVTKAVEGNIITLTNSAVTAGTTELTIDLAQQGWAHQTENPEVTLGDGTKIVFAAGEGTTTPKFWEASKGVRCYAKNTMTISTSKVIASMVITCDSGSGTNYIGNDLLTANVSGTTFTVLNDHTDVKGGVQFRPQTIKITFAK